MPLGSCQAIVTRSPRRLVSESGRPAASCVLTMLCPAPSV